MLSFNKKNSSNIKNQPFETRSFFKRSGMWTVAKIVQALITLLVFYVYAILLSKTDYGTYQKVFVVISFLTGVLCFGFPSLISSLPHKDLEQTFYSIIKKSKWIILIAFIIIVNGTLLLFQEQTLTNWILILFISLIGACNNVLEIYALKKSKDRFVFVQSLLYTGIYLLIHFLLLSIGYELDILLFLILLLATVRFLFLYFKVNVVSSYILNDKVINAKSQFYQWNYLAFHETVEAFSKYIDKIVLISLITAADFAVYFNGSYEIPFIGILVSAAGTFLNLQITQHLLDNTSILRLFKTSVFITATLLFPLFFYAWLYAPILISVFFKNKYNDAVPFFLIYSLVIPLRIGNYTAILQSKMHNNIIMTGSISALLLKMVLMLVCYPYFGILGIAIAVVAGTYYQVLFYLIATKKVLFVKFRTILPFYKLATLFIISGIVAYAGFLLLSNYLHSYLLIGGGIIFILTSMVLYQLLVRRQLNTV